MSEPRSDSASEGLFFFFFWRTVCAASKSSDALKKKKDNSSATILLDPFNFKRSLNLRCRCRRGYRGTVGTAWISPRFWRRPWIPSVCCLPPSRPRGGLCIKRRSKKEGPKKKRPEQRSTFMPGWLGLGLLIRRRCSLGVLIVHYMILNYPKKGGFSGLFFCFPIGAVLCSLLACSITVSSCISFIELWSLGLTWNLSSYVSRPSLKVHDNRFYAIWTNGRWSDVILLDNAVRIHSIFHPRGDGGGFLPQTTPVKFD